MVRREHPLTRGTPFVSTSANWSSILVNLELCRVSARSAWVSLKPMNTTKRSLLRGSFLATLLVTATLGGCAGQIGSNGKIHLTGPGPTIAVGAGLAVAGGLLTYKTRTDDRNEYNTDGLVGGIGIGMMAVGVGAILYGAYQLTVSSDAPQAATATTWAVR